MMASEIVVVSPSRVADLVGNASPVDSSGGCVIPGAQASCTSPSTILESDGVAPEVFVVSSSPVADLVGTTSPDDSSGGCDVPGVLLYDVPQANGASVTTDLELSGEVRRGDVSVADRALQATVEESGLAATLMETAGDEAHATLCGGAAGSECPAARGVDRDSQGGSTPIDCALPATILESSPQCTDASDHSFADRALPSPTKRVLLHGVLLADRALKANAPVPSSKPSILAGFGSSASSDFCGHDRGAARVRAWGVPDADRDDFPSLPDSQAPRWIRFASPFSGNDAQDPGPLFNLSPDPLLSPLESPTSVTSVDPQPPLESPILDAPVSAPPPTPPGQGSKYIPPRAHILKRIASYEAELLGRGPHPSPRPTSRKRPHPHSTPHPVARPTSSRPRPVGALWLRPSRPPVPLSPLHPARTVTSLSASPPSPPPVQTRSHVAPARPFATPRPPSTRPSSPPSRHPRDRPPPDVPRPPPLPHPLTTSRSLHPPLRPRPLPRFLPASCRPWPACPRPHVAPQPAFCPLILALLLTCPSPPCQSPRQGPPPVYPKLVGHPGPVHRLPLTASLHLAPAPVRTFPRALGPIPPHSSLAPPPPLIPDPVPPSSTLHGSSSRRHNRRNRGLGGVGTQRLAHGTVRGSWSGSQLIKALYSLCDTPLQLKLKFTRMPGSGVHRQSTGLHLAHRQSSSSRIWRRRPGATVVGDVPLGFPCSDSIFLSRKCWGLIRRWQQSFLGRPGSVPHTFLVDHSPGCFCWAQASWGTSVF